MHYYLCICKLKGYIFTLRVWFRKKIWINFTSIWKSWNMYLVFAHVKFIQLRQKWLCIWNICLTFYPNLTLYFLNICTSITLVKRKVKRPHQQMSFCWWLSTSLFLLIFFFVQIETIKLMVMMKNCFLFFSKIVLIYLKNYESFYEVIITLRVWSNTIKLFSAL